MTLDLPPVVEAVRHALLAPSPVQASPAQLNGDTTIMVDRWDRQAAAIGKLATAQQAHLRAGMDALASAIKHPSPPLSVDQLQLVVSSFDGALAQQKTLVSELETTRDRVLQIPVDPSARAAAKRVLNQIIGLAVDHHDVLVGQYYRAIALKAELDADSRTIIDTGDVSPADYLRSLLPA